MTTEELKQQLIDTDKAFSEMSLREGISKAFIAYAEEEAVIYRDKTHPIEGLAQIKELYQSDSGHTLEWHPTSATVAASGDLGYTLGKYTLTTKIGDVHKGYYVSIWKRQANGKWKYVFDSGINAPEDI